MNYYTVGLLAQKIIKNNDYFLSIHNRRLLQFVFPLHTKGLFIIFPTKVSGIFIIKNKHQHKQSQLYAFGNLEIFT